MMFEVGQLVVCVDGKSYGWRGIFPTEGRIYTVEWCGHEANPDDGYTGEAVHLAELKRPPSRIQKRVVPYRVSRFRPCKPTNIEIFKEIVANPHKELVAS